MLSEYGMNCSQERDEKEDVWSKKDLRNTENAALEIIDHLKRRIK